MTSIPALEVREVSKTFGGLKALIEVDLAVGSGEIVGIVGPNGSGKTTLLNVVTGFIPASRGSVLFQGKEVLGLRPDSIAKKGLARTFQQAAVFPEITVLGNVVAGLHRESTLSWANAIIGGPRYRSEKTRLDARAHEVLSWVGLEGKETMLAGDLGVGEQKHLGIAIAIAIVPTVLMLDEPAAGMGDVEVERLVAVLRRLRQSGLTLVIVEHNMDLIMGLCDRVVVLEFGIKIAEGSPEEIRSHERVIAAYLGKGMAKRAQD